MNVGCSKSNFLQFIKNKFGWRIGYRAKLFGKLRSYDCGFMGVCKNFFFGKFSYRLYKITTITSPMISP